MIGGGGGGGDMVGPVEEGDVEGLTGWGEVVGVSWEVRARFVESFSAMGGGWLGWVLLGSGREEGGWRCGGGAEIVRSMF